MSHQSQAPLASSPAAPAQGTTPTHSSAAGTSENPTIVLIHGLWTTPLIWEHWVAHYEAKGFQVLTPGYPGVVQGEAGVAALRADPSPLVKLGVRDVYDHLAAYIAKIPGKPIIIGHSFGGLFAQKLVGAGYGRAGVSLHGAGVKGIHALPFSEIRSAFPVMSNPANRHRAVPITEKQFHYAFTNNLTLAESRPVYDRYAVPVSGRMLFERGSANFCKDAPTAYDFTNAARPPLLFISGGNDHLIPPSVLRENYQRNVKGSSAVTAYKTFLGRDHYTCGEDGWEAVADFALEWALKPQSGELK